MPTVTAAEIRSRPPVPASKQWLTVMEVAREYGISRQTLYQLCLQGKLPYYVIPSGRRRFRRDEIEPILAPNRVPVTSSESRVRDPMGGLSGPVRISMVEQP